MSNPICKVTLIHHDDFIKVIPSLIETIVQEYKHFFVNLTLISILFSNVKMSENILSH